MQSFLIERVESIFFLDTLYCWHVWMVCHYQEPREYRCKCTVIIVIHHQLSHSFLLLGIYRSLHQIALDSKIPAFLVIQDNWNLIVLINCTSTSVPTSTTSQKSFPFVYLGHSSAVCLIIWQKYGYGKRCEHWLRIFQQIVETIHCWSMKQHIFPISVHSYSSILQNG